MTLFFPCLCDLWIIILKLVIHITRYLRLTCNGFYFSDEGVTGVITATNHNMNKKTASCGLRKKDSCYILQDDQLCPLFTVEETMLTASDLKLGDSMSKKSKELLVSFDNLFLNFIIKKEKWLSLHLIWSSPSFSHPFSFSVLYFFKRRTFKRCCLKMVRKIKIMVIFFWGGIYTLQAAVEKHGWPSETAFISFFLSGGGGVSARGPKKLLRILVYFLLLFWHSNRN